jgi:hypothetical protein
MALRDLPETLGAACREFLRHGSPRILLALLLLALGLRLALSGFGAQDLFVALAIALFWPLQEWLIHVFVLHYEPRTLFGRRLDFTVPRMHRAHHRDPWQLELVFIPLQVFVYAPFLLLALGWLVLPSARLAATFLAVYYALALHYEWVHFLVHTRYRPRSRLYARLWRNHRLHHFKNERYWYGVTMLSGDRLLGTAPPRDAVPTSPTARSLGEAPG